MTLARVAELNHLGLECKRLGRCAEGRAQYERALALLERLPDADPEDIATLYHNLGGIEHARGASPERVAADMVALGAILDGLGQYDEAERLYLDALAVFERAPAQHAANLAVALNDLGAQYILRGRLEEAEALLRRAAALKRSLHGPHHPSVVLTLENLEVLGRSRAGLDK